ncbi:MAG: 16S rRNA (uracil(1498)-N(3))-methyltransferase [Chloroflexi bacterium]|nr:16S rRNA (uracil(1498)-N(3))-methyltransferase [Chloroflexota bacterium]
MSLPRFYVSEQVPGAGSTIRLSQDTGRQVQRVLRLRPGDEIVIFDGSGPEWSAEIVSSDRAGVSVAVGRSHDPGAEPDLRVTVCQALVPSERMEFVVQKGTELGAARFVPIVSERVQAKDSRPTEHRIERWRKIAVEAAEQSGRTRVPEILPVESFENCVSRLGAEGPLVLLWEEERGMSLRTAARESVRDASRHVGVLIGPVGGLSAAEVHVARSAGALIAGAGPRILRAETAPIVALSVLMCEASELE